MHRNRNFRLNLILIVATLFIVIILTMANAMNNYVLINSLVKTEDVKKYTEEELEVGRKGYISQAVITQQKTGTLPFDADDEPGNDSSDSNNVVRSFDQITWTVENTMKLKDMKDASLKGGVIEFEIEVSESLSGLVLWDKSSMIWAEDGVVSNGGTKFSGKYSLSTKDTTVPGKQTLIFVLKVLGASNGLEISPKIKVNLAGNDETEKVEITGNTILTSAKPQYNVELKRNDNLYKEIEFDDNGVTRRGRLYGYNLTYQLYNPTSAKGMRGVEYPNGNIGLDIEMKLEKVNSSNTSDLKDITNEATPMLYNYKLNYYDNVTGYLPNREMNVTRHAAHEWRAPTPIGGGMRACFDSGNVEMSQTGNVIHVNINDYKFNGEFPREWVGSHSTEHIVRYPDNVGCFNVSYFQVFVPFNEVSSEGGYTYYLTVEDKNLNATSISGQNVNTQEFTGDDLSRIQHHINVGGSFTEYHWLQTGYGGYSGNAGLYSYYFIGDAKASIGQKFVYRVDIGSGDNNDIDKYMNAAQCLLKFDGEAFKPAEIDGFKWKKISNNATNCIQPCDMELQMLYAAKPDGKNWESDLEMKDANEEDLVFFKTEEELHASLGEDAICVGSLFESLNGTIIYSCGPSMGMSLECTNKAETGKVYQFVSTSRLYKDALDRTIQTRTNRDAVFPEPSVQLKFNYVKTAYDENGNIIVGTHKGGYTYGQSILVISGNATVTTGVEDKTSSGSPKVNYDIGKNENIVTYNVKPKLNLPKDSSTKVDNVTVTVTDILPDGIKYVPGSANTEYGEPIITENEDGTTTLKWEIYGQVIGEEVPTLIFSGNIDAETPNGKQYLNTAIVEADKVEASLLETRTATSTIQVINLSSYALFKTTDTPIIEQNGEIHYKLTLLNKTDDSIPDFQLLDVLSYNGDDRKTAYDGDYSISKITIKQINTATGEEKNDDNLKLKITNNINARTTADVQSDTFAMGTDWKTISEGTISEKATAIAVVGPLFERERLEIDIYLKTNNNLPYNLYGNSASARVNKLTDPIQTSSVKTEVVKRTLEGKVWFDANKDGLLNNDEQFLLGTKVYLLNEDGSRAKDIEDREIAPIVIGTDGTYKFEDMKKGNYIVYAEYETEGGIREVTTKDVGNNKEINSKFNSNAKTDVITALNSIASPEIKVQNENLGVTYKKAGGVIVHHYIMETNGAKTSNPVPLENGTTAEDVIFEGKIKDLYNTNSIIPEHKYALAEEPVNKTGEMKNEVIHVYYYYKRKPANVTVHHYIEKADGTKTTQKIKYADGTEVADDVLTGFQGDIYNTEPKTNISPKYKLDIIPSNKTGEYTENTPDVIYYYIERPSSVLVHHLIMDNDGNKTTIPVPLVSGKNAEDILIEGFVGDKYETEEANVLNKYTFAEKSNNYKGTMGEEQIVVNYYYKLKDTSVLVHHYIEGTEDKVPLEDGLLAEDIVKPGKVDDAYDTRPETNLDFKYEVVDDKPENKSGIMTVDQIEVTYYYRLKPSGVDINYYLLDRDGNKTTKKVLDIDGNEIDTKKVEGRIGDEYTTAPAENVMSKYELVEDLLPDNNFGNMTEERISVTYYYRLKDTKVIVHHYEDPEDTEGRVVKLSEDETISGRVDDEYKTNPTTDIPTKYELVITKMPTNKEGYMTEDTIEVIYYYRTKDAKLNIRYLEKDLTGQGIEKELENEEHQDGRVEEDYITEAKQIEGYKLVEDSGNTKGKLKEEPITVIFYYLKETKVIVNYIDINTNQKILDENGKDSTIVVDGLEGTPYMSFAKDFDNYVLVDPKPNNAKGNMTKEEIVVNYYYAHISGGVIEKHIDVNNNGILANEGHDGNEGDEYDIQSRIFEGYDLVEERLPTNAKGKMKVEPESVIYYYIKKSKVVVHYIDSYTNEEIKEVYINEVTKEKEEKDSTEEIIGHEKEQYNTNQKEFENYELVEIIGDANGELEAEPKEVIYKYKYKTKVIVKYIDVETNEEITYFDEETEKLVDTGEEIIGYEGDEYETRQKTIPGYDLVEEPDEIEGKMTKEEKEVVYKYRRPAYVVVRYLDEETEEEIEEIEVYEGYKGKDYQTEEKQIEYYTIVEEKYPENTEGKMKVEVSKDEDGKEEVVDTIYVEYYYRKLKFNLSIEKKLKYLEANGNRYYYDSNFSKFEFNHDLINELNMNICYSIIVENTEELPGSATIIEEIPQNTWINDETQYWKQIKNNQYYYNVDYIEPGEVIELELKLRCDNGNKVLGTKQNKVSLKNIENEANFEETLIEDNDDSATIIIAISTGLDDDEEPFVVTLLIWIALGISLYLFKSEMRKKM